MVYEKPRLTASEIEEELLVELQKLPTLHNTQSVTIRPYSGPKSFTWELDSIEPEVGPEQIAEVTNVVARFVPSRDIISTLAARYLRHDLGREDALSWGRKLRRLRPKGASDSQVDTHGQ